ncbi:MAG TPA: RimK family alpha-L-glutamate ligase [Bacteroides sp.]|nr:RimK family alpha-L-glutamate ligase [Bacteroides sp.]
MRTLVLTVAERSQAVRAIVRGGKKRGHTMLIVDPMRMNLLISNKSSGYDRIYLTKEDTITRVNMKDVDAIIPRIGQHVNYSSFIVDHLSNNLGIYSTQSAEGILNAANKLRTLQICSDAGIPTPRTIGINVNSPLTSLIEKIGGFPIVIKLLHGSGGEGVALLRDKSSAISTIQSLMKARTGILLQEYINSGGKDYRVIVMGNKVVVSYQRSAPRGEIRTSLQIGGQGTPVNLSEEDLSICIRAAKATGLSIAGVDLIKDHSGKPYVIEVNSNFGFRVEKITGVDVADYIIRYVESNYEKVTERYNLRSLLNENHKLRNRLDLISQDQHLCSICKQVKRNQVNPREQSSNQLLLQDISSILKLYQYHSPFLLK